MKSENSTEEEKVNLNSQNEEEKKIIKEIKISDYFKIGDFKDTIPLAALGARICYSKKSLEELLKEPKVSEANERATFLERLAKSGHFSVFAHSFAYKHIGFPEAGYLAAKYYKTQYNVNNPEIIGASLRHLVEEIPKDKYNAIFQEITQYDVPILPLGNTKNVVLLYKNEDFDGWASFYITGISRITTHQLVRHTTLNFSQRSQRYIKEDENYTIMPPSIEEDVRAKELFSKIDKNSEETYGELLKLGIRKEDARYILPHGRNTTIMVSAPIVWIMDFINKRNKLEAQWEIRSVAEQMKYLIEKY